MFYFCGPLQTRSAQTVHGPQFIAAFPVPSACNNLFTRAARRWSVILLAAAGHLRHANFPQALKQ